MIYAKFVPEVKLALIKHAQEEALRECGGFLYGTISQHYNDIICNIYGLYYEKRLGTNNEFVFSCSYIANAKNYLTNFQGLLLLGTYHSHGQYPAQLSDIDRNELQKFFGSNKITMIYSPAYSHLMAEYMDNIGVSHKMKII